MSPQASKTALITSAMVVATIRIWTQLRGKARTPFNEWAIGWGATFFILALLTDVIPVAGGALAMVVAGSDFLRNGVSLTTDISNVITGREKGDTFVPHPFTNQ